jgi:hypothetical protein
LTGPLRPERIGGDLRGRSASGIAATLATLAALAAPGLARAQAPAHLDGSPLDVFVDGLGGLQVRFDGQTPSFETGEFCCDAEETDGNGFALRGADGSVSTRGEGVVNTAPPVVSGPDGGTRTVTTAYDVTTLNSDHNPDIRVHVDQTVSYTDASHDVQVHLAIKNIGTQTASFTVGELADLYAGGSDVGTGALTGGGSTGQPRFVGGVAPAGGVDGLVEVPESEWTHFEEGAYDTVFEDFAAGQFNDQPLADNVDNEVGAEWAVNELAPQGIRDIQLIWRFDARRIDSPAIASPPAGSAVDQPLTFTGTAPPNSEVIVLRDDAQEDGGAGEVDAGGHWTAQYSPLEPGTYTFRAYTVDPQTGAISFPSAPVTLTVGGPPAPQASVSGSTVTLSGQATPNAPVTILDDGTPVTTVNADDNGNWTAVLTGVSPGTHRYTYTVGDSSVQSPTRTVTVAGPPAAATPAPTPTPTATPTPVPPPVVGKQVNVTPRGTVKVKVPGSNAFVELTAGAQLPTGTVIDTTHGRITLTTAVGGGKTQHADFYQGIFKVTQTGGRHPVTQLALAGPKPTCTTKGKRRAHASAARKGSKKKVKSRSLWGSGHGSFRTKGQYSSATVRGTTWLTQDTCAGTLTRVTHGVVQVQDFVRHKKVLVRAGHRYLARAKRH